MGGGGGGGGGGVRNGGKRGRRWPGCTKSRLLNTSNCDNFHQIE